jgi:hypothetical protein
MDLRSGAIRCPSVTGRKRTTVNIRSFQLSFTTRLRDEIPPGEIEEYFELY